MRPVRNGLGAAGGRSAAEPPPEQPPEPLPDPPPEPAVLPGIEPAILSGPEPPPAAPDAPALHMLVKRLGQPHPILLAWAASLAVLGALIWAMIAWRADVMRAWPPSERLYAALGLLRR